MAQNALIHQRLSRTDNFTVLIHDPATGQTAAIDAPDEASVDAGLAETGWRLSHILVTHAHFDHVEGIPGLKRRHGCRVIAPAKAPQVPDVDQVVCEGDQVTIGGLTATVIETPGHCPDHVAYWFANEKKLFAGDTLFALGCGRMMGSTAEEFWQSLSRLAALPDDTEVYCGHEYTLANARFACAAEPENTPLRERTARIEALRAAGEVTLPTTIGMEKATNPFLRAGSATRFAELREWKNRF